MIETILRALSEEGGHLLVSTGSGSVDGVFAERAQAAIASSTGLRLLTLPAGDADQWLATINRLIADLPISRALAGDGSFMRETTVVAVPVADSAQVAALQMLARAARALPGAGLRLMVFAAAPGVLNPCAAALGPEVIHIDLSPGPAGPAGAADRPDRAIDRPAPPRLDHPTEGLRDGDVATTPPPAARRFRLAPGSAVAMALSLLAIVSALWYSADTPKPAPPPAKPAAVAAASPPATAPAAAPVVAPVATDPPVPPAPVTSPPAGAPSVTSPVTPPPATAAQGAPAPPAEPPQPAIPAAPQAPSASATEATGQAPRTAAPTATGEALLSLVCSAPSVAPPVLRPVNPSKPGDMVYLSSTVRQAVCVTDGSGKVTRAIVEIVDGRSFFGPPPWVIQVAAPDATQVFFQGSRIRVQRWVDGRIGLEAR